MEPNTFARFIGLCCLARESNPHVIIYFLNIHFNIIFPPISKCSKWNFPHRHPVGIFLLLIRSKAYDFSRLDHSTLFEQTEYLVTRTILMQFCFITSSPWVQIHFLCPVLENTRLMFFPQCARCILILTYSNGTMINERFYTESRAVCH